MVSLLSTKSQTSPIQQPVWGITGPAGFYAQGAHAGIKRKRKDLCILHSPTPAVIAAMFTMNTVKAAPILWSQQVYNRQKPIHAIVINSGNANACTGEEGMRHAEWMAVRTAQMMHCKPEEVLVASTGIIGVPLPIQEVLQGIETTAPLLGRSEEDAHHAAEAILTTDTFTKEMTVAVPIGGKTVLISGMAKGSGMIHPNMATMLSFITTDAAIHPDLLQKALRDSVEGSYHMISVDGDTSTNDMVVAMANGLAGNRLIDEEGADFQAFRHGLHQVNAFLAQSIAKDGEGATKFLTVQVKGAKDDLTARKLGKAIISSNLVKAAFYGEDANWGRILAAMGATGLTFDTDQLSLSLSSTGGILDFYHNGSPLPLDEEQAKTVLGAKEITLQVQLAEGSGSATAWGCDLSNEYVHINSHYRS